MDHEWECVVVGGGAAGLSAALVLARARRRTLLIDAGEPSNGVAPAIGGLLGHDRRPPHELYAQGRRELAAYPTFTFREGCVVRGAPTAGGSVLDLDDGSQVTAKRVLLATGMQYCPPSLPGMDKFWGTTVFQCPFCHAWELRDQRLATLAAGAEGVNTALMLRGWSDDVVLLTDGPSDLSSGDRSLLDNAKVTIDERRIAELLGQDGQLTAIAFSDGTRLERDGLLVEAPLRQRSELASQLGAQCAAGELASDAIDVDEMHRTTVHSVFAAGDTCTEEPSVASAIAAGSQAAKIIVQSLFADEFGLPYPPGSN